jgi:5-methylthioribose kinase
VSWDYELLTPASVPAYVAGQSRLRDVVDPDTLLVSEVGDGNLNLVFVCRDAADRGICLKQSLPYVRLVGEGWPLTPHRATAEARAYTAAAKHAPEFIPEYYGFDPDRFILAMENLDRWPIWRGALNRGEIHRGVEEDMGRYMARLAFYTSLFWIEAKEVKARAAEAINPQLCEITEDLVFTEPYIDHEHNSYLPDLTPVVMELRHDDHHVAEVGRLKYQFMTAAQALIHGDLHTGSGMVTHGADGRARGKAIDPEFCFYGPVGFDVGALFGNYLIAQARAAAMRRPPDFTAWLTTLIEGTWSAFAGELRRLWPDRRASFLSDLFLEDWLTSVLQDAAGVGGCKAIRRIVGLAKVSDIQTLEGEAHLSAATAVLRAASRWIKERSGVTRPCDLQEIAADVITQEVG